MTAVVNIIDTVDAFTTGTLNNVCIDHFQIFMKFLHSNRKEKSSFNHAHCILYGDMLILALDTPELPKYLLRLMKLKLKTIRYKLPIQCVNPCIFVSGTSI